MVTTSTPTVFDERVLAEFKSRAGFDLKDHMIMACYMGSETHGTRTTGPNSIDDVDIFAVVVPPKDSIIGLREWEHCVFIKDELDVTVFSLRKWIRLLLKNNPNVLGTLWLPNEFYMYTSYVFNGIRHARDIFSSQQAYYAFSGYAHDQLTRLKKGKYSGYMGAERKALVDKFGYDPKMASHLIRLYRMGIEFVETGELSVFRPDREELKAIKRGDWTITQVHEEAEKLKLRMDAAKHTSTLPIEPDFDAAEKIVMDAHMMFLLQEGDK